MRYLKIILPVLFVLIVGFFAVRGCVHKKAAAPSVTLGAPAAKKKVVLAPRAGEKQPAVVPAQKVSQPKIAIILDDWGNNYSVLKYAVGIGRPVTLSILPNLSQSRRIAEEAFASHLGVMLHMPMQPKSDKERLEPHTILTTTPDQDIQLYLDQAIASVPHADGVNNHMGSAATGDRRVMKVVLNHLKSKGLFFVDSYVIPETVTAEIANDIHIPFAKRDVFIDNQMNLISIKEKLEKAKKIALTRGTAVVIGHDRKMTLQAIKEVAPAFEKEGIRFVLAKEVVRTT